MLQYFLSVQPDLSDLYCQSDLYFLWDQSALSDPCCQLHRLFRSAMHRLVRYFLSVPLYRCILLVLSVQSFQSDLSLQCFLLDPCFLSTLLFRSTMLQLALSDLSGPLLPCFRCIQLALSHPSDPYFQSDLYFLWDQSNLHQSDPWVLWLQEHQYFPWVQSTLFHPELQVLQSHLWLLVFQLDL
jgi:hypothetical protein